MVMDSSNTPPQLTTEADTARTARILPLSSRRYPKANSTTTIAASRGSKFDMDGRVTALRTPSQETTAAAPYAKHGRCSDDECECRSPSLLSASARLPIGPHEGTTAAIHGTMARTLYHGVRLVR